MQTVGLGEAKKSLDTLVDAASRGEVITITKAGRPVAQLVAVLAQPPVRKPGSMKGKIWIADDFDAPLDPSAFADAVER